jgi:hypothetical protein
MFSWPVLLAEEPYEPLELVLGVVLPLELVLGVVLPDVLE